MRYWPTSVQGYSVRAGASTDKLKSHQQYQTVPFRWRIHLPGRSQLCISIFAAQPHPATSLLCFHVRHHLISFTPHQRDNPSPLLIGATIAVAGKDCPLLSLRQWHRHGGQSTEAPTRCFNLSFRFNSPVRMLQGVFCYGKE